jgi:hypothetical protein
MKFVSVIKEIKREKQTFLGLQVGDNLYQIAYKMGIMRTDKPDDRYDMPKTDHLNVDGRTKNQFLLIDNSFVSKVNENYALIVKVRQSGIRTAQEMDAFEPYAIEFTLDVNYFVLGTDDSGKTFIHYLDNERNKMVRVHELDKNVVLWYHEMENGKILDYYMKEDPEMFSKYKELDLNLVLYHMNREEAGFKRVQGDLVLKLVEGKMGFCQTCPAPLPSPSGKTFLNPTHGEPKMLYKIEPALNYSHNICIDCIKHLNRNHHIQSSQQMGNHLLLSDQYEQFIEIGDSFSFNNTVITLPEDVDITEFKESLAPGRMVVAKGNLFVSTDSIAAPGKLADTSSTGYKFGGSDFSEIATTMWAGGFVGQPNIIVALGGQNVMLEHQEHETKSVYIPKDSIGVFTFQRTAPEVLGAE